MLCKAYCDTGHKCGRTTKNTKYGPQQEMSQVSIEASAGQRNTHSRSTERSMKYTSNEKPSGGCSSGKIDEPLDAAANTGKVRRNGIFGGAEVFLKINSEHVATGTLQLEKNARFDNALKRSIHGHATFDFQPHSQNLAVIHNVSAFMEHVKRNYPYSSPTVDVLPEFLGDLYPSGIYVWETGTMDSKE